MRMGVQHAMRSWPPAQYLTVAHMRVQIAFQGIGSFPMAQVASMRRVQSGTVPPQLQVNSGRTSPRAAFSRFVLSSRAASEDLGYVPTAVAA